MFVAVGHARLIRAILHHSSARAACTGVTQTRLPVFTILLRAPRLRLFHCVRRDCVLQWPVLEVPIDTVSSWAA